METKDLDKLSKETGLEIPGAYREFMMSFPADLYDLENEAGESFAEYEFLDDLDRLLELNEEVREDPYFCEEDGKEKVWPPGFLVIGENGNGDYFCVDIENDPLTVYFFLSKEGDFTEFADDLEAFVEILKNGPEEIVIDPVVPVDDDDEDDPDDDDEKGGFGDLDELDDDDAIDD